MYSVAEVSTHMNDSIQSLRLYRYIPFSLDKDFHLTKIVVQYIVVSIATLSAPMRTRKRTHNGCVKEHLSSSCSSIAFEWTEPPLR